MDKKLRGLCLKEFIGVPILLIGIVSCYQTIFHKNISATDTQISLSAIIAEGKIQASMAKRSFEKKIILNRYKWHITEKSNKLRHA